MPGWRSKWSLPRLSGESPAGCGLITADEAEAATPILRDLFGLFDDDDVLDVFD
jgi:hypothetical protein